MQSSRDLKVFSLLSHKKWFVPLLRYGLAVVLFFIFKDTILSLDFSRFWQLSGFDLGVLFTLKVLIYLLSSIRYSTIGHKIGIKISYTYAYTLNNVGLLTSYLIPSSVLSDVSKVFYLKKINSSYVKIMSSLFFDRLSGLVSMLMLLVLSTFIMGIDLEENKKGLYLQTEWVRQGFLVVVIAMIVIGVFLYTQRRVWMKRYEYFRHQWQISHMSLGFFIKVAALSMCAHLLCVLFIYKAVQWSGDVQVTFLEASVIFPVSTFGTTVPTTPGSVGVGQAIYKYVIDLFTETSTNTGVIVFTVYQLLDLPFVIYGALFILFDLISRRRLRQ